MILISFSTLSLFTIARFDFWAESNSSRFIDRAWMTFDLILIFSLFCLKVVLLTAIAFVRILCRYKRFFLNLFHLNFFALFRPTILLYWYKRLRLYITVPFLVSRFITHIFLLFHHWITDVFVLFRIILTSSKSSDRTLLL